MFKTAKSQLIIGGLAAICIALITSTVQAESLTLPVNANDYRIIDINDEQKIEMEGFNQLMVPGKPMLPCKNYMLALPPGALVQSVEVIGNNPTPLSGSYSINPTPPTIPAGNLNLFSEELRRMQEQYTENKESVYSSDEAYPPTRGKLKCRGTLRKYSYASVSFYPFSYHPQSGKLLFYETANIIINYSLPSPGSEEAQYVEQIKWDTVADERASELFINFDQFKDLYQPNIPLTSDILDIHDYVIITTSDLLSAVTTSDFYFWKTSLGYNVKIVLTTDPEIAGQSGSDLAEQIRNFLRNYYGTWGIEYVLLVGDYATVPMRYCFPDPSNHSFNPYNPYNYGGEVPTDYYYADLSYFDAFSWDYDQDGYYGEFGEDYPDFLAEVYVGRVPTSETDRITYALDKLVDYEQDTGNWKSNALNGGSMLFFTNQDGSGYPKVDGATYMDYMETDIMGGWSCNHYSEQEGLEISDYSWPAISTSVFISDWRNGQYGVVNWAGHGGAIGAARSVWSWDDGDGVPEGSEISMPMIIDVNSNLDDDYPSIVFAVSCLVGFPEPNSYGRLGVDLLTKPGFGSSAGVLSASRSAAVSVDWPTNPGGAGSFVYDFNRFLIVESRKVGEAIYDAKFYVHDNFGWEDWFYEYKNLYDYNLYGDPALVQPGVAGSPLDCDMTINTPRVPSVNADIQFDLTVENVGATTFNNGLFAELYPIIGDCVNGTNFDFDLKSRLTSEPLTPGGTFTGYYNFHVDSVAGSFELASLNIGIGGSDDEWECFCCDEFYFTRSWNRQGGSSGNIWRNPEWNELGDEIIPYSTSLGQNYPNPFNASTTISYTLSSTSDVNLEVYNLLGQKIETLINGEVEAGNHSITWDASSLSSGIYFSKLTVGNFVSTRKLNLLK